MKSFASSASYSIDLTAYQQSLIQLSNQIKASLNEIKNTTLLDFTEAKANDLAVLEGAKVQAISQVAQEATGASAQIIQEVRAQANLEIVAIQQKGALQISSIEQASLAAAGQIDSINTAVQQMQQQYAVIEQNLALVQPYVEALVQQAEDQLAVFIQAKQTDAGAELTAATGLHLAELQTKLQTALGNIQQQTTLAGTAISALKDQSLADIAAGTTAKLAEMQAKIAEAEAVFAQLDQAVGASIQSYQEIQNLVNQAQLYIQQVVDTAVQEAQLELNNKEQEILSAIIAQQVTSVAAVNAESSADVALLNTLTLQKQEALQTTVTQGVNLLNSTLQDDLNALQVKQQNVIGFVEDARDAALNSIQVEETQAQTTLQSFENQLLASLSSAKELATTQLHDYFLTLVQQLQAQGTSGGGSGLLVGAIMYTANSQQWVSSGRWLLCKGQQFDPNAFPALYSFLGTNVLPNLTDMFVRCIDDSGARAPLSFQLDSLKAHRHFVQINTTNAGGHSHSTSPVTINATTATAGAHDHRLNGYSASGVGGTSSTSATGDVVVYNNDGQTVTSGLSNLPNTTASGIHSHTLSVIVPALATDVNGDHGHIVQGYTADEGASETAPKNVALYAIIKTDNL